MKTNLVIQTAITASLVVSTAVLANPLYKQDIQGYWSASGGQSTNSAGNPSILFNLPTHSNVSVELNSSVDNVLYLVDQHGNLLFSDDNGGHGTNAQLNVDLSAGDYRVIAATSQANQTGEFNLKISEGTVVFRDRINIQSVSQFHWIYDDSGTGSDQDLTIFRPNLSGLNGYYSLGDLAIKGRHQPGSAIVVKSSLDVLARPTDYHLIWKDSGSGGDHDGSFWDPIPPTGYTCLGMIVQRNYSKPSTDAMRCIKSEYVLRGSASKVWDDSGSGANWNLGLWNSTAQNTKGLATGTFKGSRHHHNTGGDRFWVLNKDRINEPGMGLPADPAELALRYAPRVFLHSDESCFPSSVEWFQQHTHIQGGRYVTDQALGCDSCTEPVFLDGKHPNHEVAPTYAMIVPKGNQITDIVYWMFYPYNNGKRVCIGWYSPWGCVGGYSTFGNHVGDWEHMTVRLVNGQASQVFLSQHANGQTFNWGDSSLAYDGTHPLVFSAKGSHGLYPDARRHIYKNLPNGDFLADDTNHGPQWDTWQNLKVIQWKPIGQFEGGNQWLNFNGRWGNVKSGCGIAESVSGECVLNDGPTGPMMKKASDPNYSGLD